MITPSLIETITAAIADSLFHWFPGNAIDIYADDGQWIIKAVNNGPNMVPLCRGEEPEKTCMWLVTSFDFVKEEYSFEELAY